MQSVIDKPTAIPATDRERTWPLDARMAMFVLEAGGSTPPDARSRSLPREACRMMATLCDPNPRVLAQTLIYIRDKDAKHLGFISQTDLPAGKTMWLHCTVEDGRTLRVPCRINRVRPFMTGWIEGVLHLGAE